MLTDVLCGANNDRIRANKLNALPEYGALRGLSRENIIAIIEWLIKEEFILKTNHPKYPVFHPTYNGMHYDETMTTRKLKKLQQWLQQGNA